MISFSRYNLNSCVADELSLGYLVVVSSGYLHPWLHIPSAVYSYAANCSKVLYATGWSV